VAIEESAVAPLRVSPAASFRVGMTTAADNRTIVPRSLYGKTRT
jgi:hypothetical protein